MKDIYQIILNEYGYDEPIFTSDIASLLNTNSNSARQTIKRLADQGYIKKVRNGIYFIPNTDTTLKNPKLNVNKIIEKRYLKNQDNRIGYLSGTNFANKLGLTTQTASIPTVITNNTSSIKRQVQYYNKKIILKKPRATVTNDNYKILQVLDLINDYDRLSERPFAETKPVIFNYLKSEPNQNKDITDYLELYPTKTKLKIYESGINYEVT